MVVPDSMRRRGTPTIFCPTRHIRTRSPRLTTSTFSNVTLHERSPIECRDGTPLLVPSAIEIRWSPPLWVDPERRPDVDRGQSAWWGVPSRQDRKSTRLNSSHVRISYAVFCLKKK